KEEGEGGVAEAGGELLDQHRQGDDRLRRMGPGERGVDRDGEALDQGEREERPPEAAPRDDRRADRGADDERERAEDARVEALIAGGEAERLEEGGRQREEHHV